MQFSIDNTLDIMYTIDKRTTQTEGYKMTKTFSWKTARGADVEMNVTVEHVKTETINADGHKMEVACSKWIRKINSMKVNGKETNQK